MIRDLEYGNLMKRIITTSWLLVLVLTTTSGQTQSKYIVSDFDGKPELTTNAGKRLLRRGETLTGDSRVNIPYGAEIDLLDVADRKLHILDVSGTGKVTDLISDQKKSKEKGASARYVQHVLSQVRKNSTVTLHRVSDPAMVTRDVQTVDSIATANGFRYNSETGVYDDYRSEYQKFRDDAWKEYRDFRDEAWQEYIRFARKAWKTINRESPMELPKEKEQPPVVILDDGDDEGVEYDENLAAQMQVAYADNKQTDSFFSFFKNIKTKLKKKKINQKSNDAPPKKMEVKQVIETPKKQVSRPEPLAPIKGVTSVKQDRFDFTVFGTKYSVRLNDANRFKIDKLTDNNVVTCLEKISGDATNNVLIDCLRLRRDHHLSDWAYYLVLKSLCEQFYGVGNEATLMHAYLLSQSGYKIKLANDDTKLYMLISCQHKIYGESYYNMDGELFYLFEQSPTSMRFCRATLPNEKGLSLLINEAQEFDASNESTYTSTKYPGVTVPISVRHYQSRRYPEVKVDIHCNSNLMAFYETYPQSTLNNNEMSQWLMQGNTPMNSQVKDELYSQLKPQLQGLSRLEKVERLLNLIQTSFKYQFDHEVWGVPDRIFFSEESLFYPSCDCEDRSILLSRLVRDLVGLPTILIYYPGHLAMGVGFEPEDKATGDYIEYNGRKYTVCDPTIIGCGARVGTTQPNKDNSQATVILLSQ